MVVGGRGGRADGKADRWLCKHCKTKGNQPFWNYPDKMACHRCHGSKSNVFLRYMAPQSPSQRTPAGEAGQANVLVRKVAEMEATIKQLRQENKEVKKLGKDRDGDEDMDGGDEQDDVEEHERCQTRLKELEKAIPALENHLAQLKAERERLSTKVRAAKPVNTQIEWQLRKIANMQKKLTKQQERIKEHEDNLDEINKLLEEDRAQELALATTLHEAQNHLSSLTAQAASHPPPTPTSQVPGTPYSIDQLGLLLATVDGVNQEVWDNIKAELPTEPPRQGGPEGEVPADDHQGGAGAPAAGQAALQVATGPEGGGVQGTGSGGQGSAAQQPATGRSPLPAVPTRPACGQAPKPPTTPAAKARAASAGRTKEVESMDIEVLRTKMGAVGLGATDEQLKKLVEEFGWTLVVSKRQRMGKP